MNDKFDDGLGCMLWVIIIVSMLVGAALGVLAVWVTQ